MVEAVSLRMFRKYSDFKADTQQPIISPVMIKTMSVYFLQKTNVYGSIEITAS